MDSFNPSLIFFDQKNKPKIFRKSMISTIPSILTTPGIILVSSEPNLGVSETFLKVIEVLCARMTVNWIENFQSKLIPNSARFPNQFCEVWAQIGFSRFWTLERLGSDLFETPKAIFAPTVSDLIVRDWSYSFKGFNSDTTVLSG